MDTTIQKLDAAVWKGTPLAMSYTSDYYYDIVVSRTADGFSIPIVKKPFPTPFNHRPEDGDYPDQLYEDWWEKAEAYGIVGEDGKLLAAIEVCPEDWSKRLMVTELFVAEPLRRQGHGRRLIDLAKRLTVEGGYRCLILETQSSNVNAVDFYMSQGFTLIGFDTCCYRNTDVQRGEVRLDMGWFPEEPDQRSC